MRRRGVKFFEKYFWKIFSRKPQRGEAQGIVEHNQSVQQGVLTLAVLLAVQGCVTQEVKEEEQQPATEPAVKHPSGLKGEWCRVKKRRVTKYTVKDEMLIIRSGRSGQYFEAALTCNDSYTECQAKTIRGWGTPVTEILRLDGENMNLTRIWEGAWKGKTYNFTYTRCPKW